MGDTFGRSVGPSAGAWLPAAIAEGTAAGERRNATCLRLEGFGPSVDVRRAHLLAQIGQTAETRSLKGAESRLLWQQIGNVQPFHGQSEQAVWKLSVRPSDAPQILERLSTVAGLQVFLDWGGGLIWLSLPCGNDGGTALVRSALPRTGHATLIGAPDAIRATQAVFQPLDAVTAKLEARLKAQFDPCGILNPGRRESGAPSPNSI